MNDLKFYSPVIIVVFLLSACTFVLYKYWQKNTIVVLVTGYFVSVVAGSIALVPFELFSPYSVLINGYIVLFSLFFVWKCLCIEHNTSLLKEKTIWIALYVKKDDTPCLFYQLTLA
jgi:hypothetical protein